MNLAALLAKRDAEPVRVALIGAGKFGVRLAVFADLDLERARDAATRGGWAAEQFALAPELGSANDTIRSGKTALVDYGTLAAQCEVDIVIEATGHEEAGARHAFAAIDAGHDVIIVTVSADVVVGPYLHELARRRGVIYSMAYGDQPAIVCELVDWARACGFRVVAAGLRAPADGLSFAPIAADELATYFANADGIADVVSNINPDGHSIASIACRGEETGAPSYGSFVLKLRREQDAFFGAAVGV